MDCKIVSILVLLVATAALAQENAQPRVAPALEECYRLPNLFDRDNRLPMTPNMLIELIRKAEDANTHNMDIRQMAVSLVHRFRQDGIIPSRLQVIQNDILRFSTSGFNFPKHRVLLQRLIPGNAVQFPNNTLTAQERVSHFQFQQFTAGRNPCQMFAVCPPFHALHFVGDSSAWRRGHQMQSIIPIESVARSQTNEEPLLGRH